MTVVTVVATAVALSAATANAKPPPQDRQSSSSYTVAGGFGDVESNDPYFHLEAFQDAQGAWIGFLEWNRNYVCAENDPSNPWDDVWEHYMFDFNGQDPVPAAVFTIGSRYSDAHVEGWVPGGMEYQNECTGESWWQPDNVYVSLDLTGSDTTIRETNSSWFRSPEFKQTQSFTFTGRTATGTMTMSDDGWGEPYSFEGVDGRIGLSKYRSMTIG